MKREIDFLSVAALTDLRTFMLRQAQFTGGAVWLIARDGSGSAPDAWGVVDSRLAFLAAAFAPQSLTEQMPTVLVMKSFRVVTGARGLNEVFDEHAILERLERLRRTGARQETVFTLPPVSLSASWAGVTPPFTNWQRVGEVSVESLKNVAVSGSERVAAALPAQPGLAIARQIRARVWAESMFDGVPAGAAFAMDAMGFLADQETATLYRAPGWSSLHSKYGTVLVRTR